MKANDSLAHEIEIKVIKKKKKKKGNGGKDGSDFLRPISNFRSPSRAESTERVEDAVRFESDASENKRKSERENRWSRAKIFSALPAKTRATVLFLFSSPLCYLF